MVMTQHESSLGEALWADSMRVSEQDCDAMRDYERILTPGMIFDDGSIIEVCWDGQMAYFFYKPAIPSMSIEKIPVMADAVYGRAYIPIANQLLTRGAICLAREPMEYGTASSLVGEVEGYIHEWVDTSRENEQILALYALMTWLYEKCPAVPIINFRGAAGTGKSRFLEVMHQLCFRAMKASGALTSAAIFRTADLWKGTLCINEGDLGYGAETSAMVKLLNQRYEPNCPVWRSNIDTLEPQCFACFGPTIITTRAIFADDALESRCITIATRENTRDVPYNLDERFYAQGLELRNKLLLFRLRNLASFKNDPRIRFTGLGPRLNQILQPMASIAQAQAPELMPAIEMIAGGIARTQTIAASESLDGLIVRAFYFLEQEGKEAIDAGAIHDKIAELGREVSSNMIGRRATALGFVKMRSTDGNRRPYVLPETTKRSLYGRYLLPEEMGSTNSVGSNGASPEGAPIS